MNSQKLSISQAAKHLGMARNTILKYIQSLNIQAEQLGNQKLLNAEQLDLIAEEFRKMNERIVPPRKELSHSAIEGTELMLMEIATLKKVLADVTTERDFLRGLLADLAKGVDLSALKQPSGKRQKPRQQDFSSESERSVVEIKKAASRRSNDSQKVVSESGKSNINKSGVARKKKASPQRDAVIEVINKKYPNGLPPRLEKDDLADVMNELQAHENPEVRVIEKKYVQDIASRVRNESKAS